MSVFDEYRSKLRTPDEAVKLIKDGDWVDYGSNVGFPVLLDAALAKRRDELHGVKIRGNLMFGPLLAVESDPTREHFHYTSWHLSAYERKLCDRGLCTFSPMVFRNLVWYYQSFLDLNVGMAAVTPMDKHGYFNFSCGTGVARGILEKADIIILEVNERLPRIYGGFDECIHISEVDCVVEGEHPPLPEFPILPPTPEDTAIAGYLIPHIKSGSTLQLGIGAMPNVVGSVLAESDVQDLGMHTELCGDAYYRLFQAGKLTNRRKTFQRNKGVTGMVFGSQALYDWVDQNPAVIVEPLSFVNDPAVIARHDNMISINNCIAVDLYGQVYAETAGLRQISGTGGQLDFLTGVVPSKGGAAFICMTSSFVDKAGVRHSRILPEPTGGIVTDPRSQAFWVVTEYGAVNLAGQSNAERAHRLVSVAHPDFREELIHAAEKQKIWR